MAEIRQLRAEDMEESFRLSQFAFQFELTPEEIKERMTRLDPSDSWGAFTENKLAAKLMVLPLETFIGGKRFSMGGIAGVATWPEHRRGGFVAGLLTHALKVMKEKGQTVSFLAPFKFSFYRKFGWETYVDINKYELTTVQLPRPVKPGGRVERINDLKAFQEVYEAYAARYNGTLARSDIWWENNIMAMKNKGGVRAVYYGEDGSPKGYLLYKVKDRTMDIRELIYLDDEAWRGIWSYIANHDSMIDKLLLQAPTDDILTFRLEDPRIKQEVIPYFMARIVDVKTFLEAFPFARGTGGIFQIRVLDEYAPWNDGWYTVRVQEKGMAQVEQIKEEPSDAAAGKYMICNIATLSSLFMGYAQPEFLKEIGRLTGDSASVQVLAELLPKRATYLPDFF